MTKSISLLLDKLVTKLSKDHRELFLLYRISKAWSEFIPANFANFTFPVKFSTQETLVIAVGSSAVGSQLYYHKAEIISKINSYLGRNIINDIKFALHPMMRQTGRQIKENTSITPSAVHSVILDGLDDELKASLLTLSVHLK